MTSSNAERPESTAGARKEAKISDGLEKRLKAYAVAAGAAGAVLMSPVVATANIVPITHSFSYHWPGYSNGYITVGNGVVFGGKFQNTYRFEGVSATLNPNVEAYGQILSRRVLHAGSAIAGSNWRNSTILGRAGWYNSGGNWHRGGGLRDPGSGYLGLRFFRSDGVHYGWAHINAFASYGSTRGKVNEHGQVGSIFFDTCAGQALNAGEKNAPACGSQPAPEPALPLLTLLAIGAVALPMWRARRRAALQGGRDATQA